jgi:mitochondrial fission protein ELM1
VVNFPRIWVFPGNRPGDDAQIYALAEEMRLPFETRPMAYNWRFWLAKAHRQVGLESLTEQARAGLRPPWPDLILCAAKHSVPAARWVREQNGGRTRLVYIGHPRVPPETFDLVFTTRSYLTPTGPSMRELDVALSRYRQPPEMTDEERGWLDCLPRPHLLLMLGGKTRHWKMTPIFTSSSAERLYQRARSLGGSLIVARSQRTGEEVLDAIEERLDGLHHWRVVRGDFPRFPVLLDDADELFPTFDSVSMISESIITGKPTGIVPIEMNWIGKLVLGSEVIEGNVKRDLRRFSNHLIASRMAGTIDQPRASNTPNPAVAAAQEVRAVLEKSFGTLPA